MAANELYQLLPALDIPALPEDEWVSANRLRFLCSNLVAFVSSFEAALQLFDHVRYEFPGQFSQEVPMRDGAVTLYQIGYTIDAIRGAFKNTPTAQAASDHNTIRAQAKRFQNEFPLYEQLRHSVGHAAEIFTKLDDNVLKEPVDKGSIMASAGTILNITIGCTFAKTINGQFVSYDLSEQSFETLLDIAYNLLGAIRLSAPKAA